MQESKSYAEVLSVSSATDNVDPLAKYHFFEVGQCAQLLSTLSPDEWADIVMVLRDFTLTGDLLCLPGGNDGPVPQELNDKFKKLGWRERQLDIETRAFLYDRKELMSRKNARVRAWKEQGIAMDAVDAPDVDDVNAWDEAYANTRQIARIYQPGYYVDNSKGKVMVDVEWNAKDGNIDRDLAAYRAWQEAGIIHGAVIITKDGPSARKLHEELVDTYVYKHDTQADNVRFSKLDTTTTVSMGTALKRLRRGGAGSCPVLIVGIGRDAWDGSQISWLPKRA